MQSYLLINWHMSPYLDILCYTVMADNNVNMLCRWDLGINSDWWGSTNQDVLWTTMVANNLPELNWLFRTPISIWLLCQQWHLQPKEQFQWLYQAPIIRLTMTGMMSGMMSSDIKQTEIASSLMILVIMIPIIRLGTIYPRWLKADWCTQCWINLKCHGNLHRVFNARCCWLNRKDVMKNGMNHYPNTWDVTVEGTKA